MHRIYCKTRQIRRISYDANASAQLRSLSYAACAFPSCLNIAANENVHLDSYKSRRHADYCRLLDSLATSGCLSAAMQRCTFTTDKYSYANDDR